MREHVANAMDQQAELVFRSKLARGDMRFDLDANGSNHRLRKRYEILVADSVPSCSVSGNRSN